jgi:quercetin 2,3-dioxygenase
MVPPNSEFRHSIPREKNVFAYVFEGEGYFDNCRDPYDIDMRSNSYLEFDRQCNLKNHTLIQFDAGDEILVATENSSVRFLLISGKPLNEPVAWYGPIMMNTQDELRVAFQEYQNGTFIKHK